MLNLFTLLDNNPLPNEGAYWTLRIVSYVLIALILIAAIAAIVLVLLQPSNSTGVSALGGSSETFFGKNKGKSIEARMKKWTVLCLIILAVLSIALYIVYGLFQ